jgi:hypothetical protein
MANQKKFSKEQLRRRVEILMDMTYKPSKEEIKRFLSPAPKRTEEDLQGYAIVDDDFGISEEAKKRRKTEG